MATTKLQTNEVSNAESQTPATVKFEVIFDKLHSMQNLLKEIQVQLKTAHKEVAKAIKESNQTKKKGKKTKGESSATVRAPSGFAKPTQLSADLCRFLNIDENSLLARTDVTRKINQYIKDHKLQDEKDKRNINPDAALHTLLDPSITTPLTYFNLQSRIKHHFIKTIVSQ